MYIVIFIISKGVNRAKYGSIFTYPLLKAFLFCSFKTFQNVHCISYLTYDLKWHN